MSKKIVKNLDVFKAISAGEDTREKLLHKFGWGSEQHRQKLSYHILKLKDKGLIKYENNRYHVLIDPEKVADKKSLAEVLGLIKSKSKPVREEGFKDLEFLSAKFTITDESLYKFLIEALDNPSYEDFKDVIFKILNFIYVQIEGTEFKRKFLELMKSKPDFFVEMALDKEKDERLRRSAIKSLARTDPENFIEVALDLVLDKDEHRFIQFDTAGDFMGIIGSEIIGGLRELSKENLEKAKKDAISRLKENENDELIVKRLGVFLEEIRNSRYLEKTLEIENIKTRKRADTKKFDLEIDIRKAENRGSVLSLDYFIINKQDLKTTIHEISYEYPQSIFDEFVKEGEDFSDFEIKGTKIIGEIDKPILLKGFGSTKIEAFLPYSSNFPDSFEIVIIIRHTHGKNRIKSKIENVEKERVCTV